MLTYSFEDRGRESLYDYLYKKIKEDILNGRLVQGERLPSKRALAENLNISTVTVETAYGQLAAEGYIYSKPKSGFFVSQIPEDFSYRRVKQVKQPLRQKMNEEEYFADFTANSTVMQSFPFDAWSKLMRETLSSQKQTILCHSPSQGIYELRKAIAEHLFQFRGLKVEPERIIVGAGTEYLYSLIIQLMDKNTKYAVEDPGYGKIARIYGANGVDYVRIPFERDCINIRELVKSGAKVLHISPSHHFPTGSVTPIGKRYELLRWAQSNDGFIIEDDYDSEFRLAGKPVPALQSIDHCDRVIYINTFSKSLTPTIRISYMVLPETLMERYTASLGFYSCTVSNFEQYTLAAFIERGYFEKHINRMRTYYRGRRDTIMQYIKKHPRYTKVSISEEHSGLHFLLRLDTSFSDEELKKRAREKGIKISCLSDYYYDKSRCTPATVIINYSALSEDKTEEAVELLFSII